MGKASPQGADTKAYGSLIHGCVRHGKLDVAIQLVEEVYGITPGGGGGGGVGPMGQKDNRNAIPQKAMDMEPIEQLLCALQNAGMAESKGVPLLNKLRAVKAPISGRLYSTMLNRSSGSVCTEQGK